MKGILGNKMNIPLYVYGNMYSATTIDAWQHVWDTICKMAYEEKGICESIVTRPSILCVDNIVINDTSELTHSYQYKNPKYVNVDFLTLDNIWKQYSYLYGPIQPKVIPQFKKLVVPRCLFECLGVRSWFLHSFPNCQIVFWDE
jgi:hypothetical protein